MPDDSLVQDILDGLAAYHSQYGLPESPAQLEAVIGALVNVKTREANQTISPRQIDAMIRWVSASFDAQTTGQAVIDGAKQALAQKAHQWQQDLKRQVEGVLNAYLQQHASNPDTDALAAMVTAIAPMVKSGQATRPEVVGLAEQIITTFAPASTLAPVTNPIFVELARDLSTVLSQKDTETAVSETVVAYINKFAPNAEAIGEDIIERALSAILKNQVQFGIDTDLNLAEKRLILQQVSFKLNIMEQSPIPSKSAELMAAQLNTEIERFKAERARKAGNLDPTSGRLSPDGLSITSNWIFTDRTSNRNASQE
jgi:hypothetical protein